MWKRLWCEDEGVLTFEWILLLTLLVIGVVAGVAAIRDVLIHESQGVVGAMVSLDQSYYVAPPLGVAVHPLNYWWNGTTSNDPWCTSSAAFSRFSDSAYWANGRLAPAQLSIAQPINSTGGLCALP